LLKVVVQNVFNYGVTWFPKIHQSHKDVFSSWHDLLGLIGFDHEHQHIIIEKFTISPTRLPIEQLLTFIMLDR
jgi:hypothetical protein